MPTNKCELADASLFAVAVGEPGRLQLWRRVPHVLTANGGPKVCGCARRSNSHYSGSPGEEPAVWAVTSRSEPVWRSIILCTTISPP